MENKIVPTAERYWLKTSKDSDISAGLIKPNSCTKFMIEFAELHVEQFAKDFNLSCDYRKQLVETYIRKIK